MAIEYMYITVQVHMYICKLQIGTVNVNVQEASVHHERALELGLGAPHIRVERVASSLLRATVLTESAQVFLRNPNAHTSTSTRGRVQLLYASRTRTNTRF